MSDQEKHELCAAVCLAVRQLCDAAEARALDGCDVAQTLMMALVVRNKRMADKVIQGAARAIATRPITQKPGTRTAIQ